MADLNDEKAAGAVHVPDVPLHESETPHKMSPGKYAATRISTLKPPMHKAPNPFKLLAMLSGKQWLFFLVGFFAWVCLLPVPSSELILMQHRPGMHSISLPSA